MEKRILGTSEIQVTTITFGAWAIGGWMWGGTDKKESIEAIRESLNMGVTSIDTAPAYGQGLSEELIAEAIKGMDRTKIQILTKFGLRWDTSKGVFYFKSIDNSGREINIHKISSAESVIEECENSLRRLKTDYIDLYQIHWDDPSTPIHETMEAVLKLKKQGKIRAAGVCNYNVEQMKEAEKTINLASDQVAYSMINRNIEKELVPYAIKNNKAIIAYSPLQRGLLTGKIKPGHLFNENDTRKGNQFYTDENIVKVNSFLDKLMPLAKSKNATISQLVIKWTIEQPGITIALVGARNAKQARENALAIEVLLSKEEISFINEQLKELD